VQIRKKAFSLSLVALVSAPMVGCLGRSSAVTKITSAGPNGKVAQGAVSGATIWADSLTSGTEFVIDTAEAGTKTTTDVNGNFTLPAQPSYKYVIVSQGGIDTITGKPASTLVAPGGSPTVTPLTTLVSLATTGNLASALSSLLPSGASFDTDVTASGALTPAMTVLLTAIVTAVTTFNTTVQDAATASGAALSQQQINDIDLTLYAQIAAELSTQSTADLSNTATLASSLQTALTTAITTVSTNNTNITGLNASTIATSIADNSVASAAVVVGNATGNANLQAVTAINVQSKGVTSSTTATVTEAMVLSPNNAQIIDTTINSVSSSSATGVTATSTPSSYAPPSIPVIQNPTVIGYSLAINASSNAWNVSSLTITFSDDMVATQSGGTNYAHSVLNPANYVFSQSGCSPASYATDTVTFTCANPLGADSNFEIQILASSSTGGVWSNTTSLGLPVTNTKTFTLPAVTGSTGGSSIVLF
jgi:hypothetical protein